jgi:hypoxanthine phosphoribosyltransferase
MKQPVISLHDKQFAPYISAEKISERVLVLAQQLNERFKTGEPPVFLAVLNGSFMFAADLIKHINVNCEISFVKLASYQGTQSTGSIKTLIGLDVNIKDRTVVIIEDIVDTGKTLSEFLPVLQGYAPKEIIITTLLYKPKALKYPVNVSYFGFEVPNDFLVGYGLDYDGLGRNLGEIYKLMD